jgi:DNA repair exonuclease SbcCD ATPase subunit
MANQQLRFKLIGSADDLISSFSEASSAAQGVEENLEGLEQAGKQAALGQLEYNEAAEQFVNESGDFINQVEAAGRAQARLNEVGVETTAQIRGQVQELEALKTAYQDDGRVVADLNDRQQQLRNQLAEVGEAAAQQSRDLSRLDQQFGSSTVRMGNFAGQQKQLQRELRKTASAQRQFGSAAGSADQAVTALSRGLEDVAFARDFGDAMRFAGNNVSQAAQSLGRARAEAGGLTAALSTITPATVGVAAFSALVALGPRVVDFFSDAEEGAESFEDRVDETTDSVFRLRDATQDPIRLGLEQARQSVELLSDDLNELREIRERLLSPSSPEFAAAAGAVGTPSGSKLEPRPTEALKTLRERETISEKTQDRLDKIIQQREDLNTLLRVQRRTLAEGSEITKAQVRQIQEGTASTEALVTASEEGVVRFRRLSGLADDLLGRYQSVNQLLQGQNRLVDENLVTQEQVTQELADRLEDAESIEDAEGRLNSAVEDGLITREQMQAAMEEIRSDTKDTADEAEKIAEAQRRITSAVEQEIIAREEAKALVEDLGTSNDQIAWSTAEALGNVEGLRAKFSDLVGLQGTALAQARRTKEQYQRQAEALRNVNRILARREAGIQAEQVMPAGPGSLGEMPPVHQSIQELSGQPNVLEQYAQQLKAAKIQAQGLSEALQDVELAGSDRELGQSLDEKGEGAEDASDSADEINNKFARSIQLAGRIGTVLEKSFERGERSVRDYAKVALPLLGQIIGQIAGGPAGSRIGGGVGQLAASLLAEGGLVRGKGGTTEDKIPAMLSDKEFVVQAASAQMAPEALQAINEDPALAGMIEHLVVARSPQEFTSGDSTGSDDQIGAVPGGLVEVGALVEPYQEGGYVQTG